MGKHLGGNLWRWSFDSLSQIERQKQCYVPDLAGEEEDDVWADWEGLEEDDPEEEVDDECELESVLVEEEPESALLPPSLEPPEASLACFPSGEALPLETFGSFNLLE